MSDARKKAVVLLSGGLDSSTVLAIAGSKGFDCYCLSFSYGQKHATELRYARQMAVDFGAAQHHTASIDLGAFGGSALTDDAIQVPDAAAGGRGIPVTYVPARNTVFLSFALGWAEVLGAGDIFIGVNAVDYSGYPDCRPEYIAAFEEMANLATRAGVEGHRLIIHCPLINLTKAEIILRGTELGVDYSRTVSCYRLSDQGEACGGCDSCVLRAAGFKAAGMADPTVYLAAPQGS